MIMLCCIHSLEPLLIPPDAEDTGAGCQRLLDADDPDVLKCLLETTVHEAFGWCHPTSEVRGSMVAS